MGPSHKLDVINVLRPRATRVLLFDPNKEMSMLELYLNGQQIMVDYFSVVANGFDAINLLKEGYYDVIIIDLDSPFSSKLLARNTIRRTGRMVIAIQGNNNENSRFELQTNESVRAVFGKPIYSEIIFAALLKLDNAVDSR